MYSIIDLVITEMVMHQTTTEVYGDEEWSFGYCKRMCVESLTKTSNDTHSSSRICVRREPYAAICAAIATAYWFTVFIDSPTAYSVQLKQANKEIATACKAASTFLTGTSSSLEDTGTSANNPFFEEAWVQCNFTDSFLIKDWKLP